MNKEDVGYTIMKLQSNDKPQPNYFYIDTDMKFETVAVK